MLHFHGKRAERYNKIIKVKLFVKAINNSKSETLRKISNDHAPLKKINEMYCKTDYTQGIEYLVTCVQTWSVHWEGFLCYFFGIEEFWHKFLGFRALCKLRIAWNDGQE